MLYLESKGRVVTRLSKGWEITAALVLIGTFLVLQQLASRPKSPSITLSPPDSRQPFPLDFRLSDLKGDTVRLSDFRGKVILLNFWATWCYPCRTEMPSMNAVYQDYRGKGFVVLAVASDAQGKEVVSPFVEEYDLTFPVLLDPKDVVGRRLQISGIPTTYLLDKHGRIAGVESGAQNWHSSKVHRLLDSLIAEKKAAHPAS